MNLLTERSELRASDGYPKVYAQSTFFLTRLLQSGHQGVRRWTRKVDIFAYDLLPVPVHVNGVHWCMAIIDFRNKTINYYDSMRKPNDPVLQALLEYLSAESMDKKGVPFDKTGWMMENLYEIPQQNNGSDCGVFSCMFAEFVTRNRPITFSQKNMTYFRQKMAVEILTGKMLT